MKLYHATKAENIDEINEFGLIANESDKLSCNERLNDSAVYGFTSIDLAIDFIVYDNNVSHYAIFEFESGDFETVIDPEYGDGAYAVLCEKIDATLIIEKNTLDA